MMYFEPGAWKKVSMASPAFGEFPSIFQPERLQEILRLEDCPKTVQQMLIDAWRKVFFLNFLGSSACRAWRFGVGGKRVTLHFGRI